MKSKGSSRKPKGWPDQITFLAKPTYSNLMDPYIIQKLHSKPAGAKVHPHVSGPCAAVNIRLILSSGHPAYQQRGLFASRDLAPGSLILPYIGFVHGPQDTDHESTYDLSLDRELGVGVDATTMGNEARFINDYRGISSSGPNAEFKEVWVEVGKENTERRMAVYVLHAGKSGRRSSGIKKGEEILVSYGKGFWKELTKEEQETETDIFVAK